MRAAAKWAIAGGGALLVGLLAGLGWYEHDKHVSQQPSGSNGPPHLIPIRFNPGGGAVVNVALADGDASKHVRAKAGDIVNVSLPVNSWVVSADYGAGAAWGTGAAPKSKVVSVQLKGSTTITVNWTDTDVSAKYTTQVQVTT